MLCTFISEFIYPFSSTQWKHVDNCDLFATSEVSSKRIEINSVLIIASVIKLLRNSANCSDQVFFFLEAMTFEYVAFSNVLLIGRPFWKYGLKVQCSFLYFVKSQFQYVHGKTVPAVLRNKHNLLIVTKYACFVHLFVVFSDFQSSLMIQL